MHRTDFDDIIDPETTTLRTLHHSGTSMDTLDALPTPPLTSETQSPQSSSLPSANTSTIDEPVHNSYTNKMFSTPVNGLTIKNIESASQ